MKILHVADIHLNQKWLDWLTSHAGRYDLLVIAGDLQNAFSDVSMHEQAKRVAKWLIGLPSRTLVCSGNHDFWRKSPQVSVDSSAEAAWLRRLSGCGNVIATDGAYQEIDGLWFGVNGWLQVPRPTTHLDVLVTHAPPAGCSCAIDSHGVDQGHLELGPAIQTLSPWLLLCGHLHEPRSLTARWPHDDSPTLVLVPGFDETAVEPTFWVIDTETRRATHSRGLTIGLPGANAPE